jgi:hypothetical protein
MRSFIHSVFCLTTGSKPPPKRFLHIVRSRVSSFKREYPLLSLRSSSSFLRFLPRLLVTSISPFISPSCHFHLSLYLAFLSLTSLPLSRLLLTPSLPLSRLLVTSISLFISPSCHFHLSLYLAFLSLPSLPLSRLLVTSISPFISPSCHFHLSLYLAFLSLSSLHLSYGKIL